MSIARSIRISFRMSGVSSSSPIGISVCSQRENARVCPPGGQDGRPSATPLSGQCPLVGRSGAEAPTQPAQASVARASVLLIIDETGDEKNGHSTDYVAHQSIGTLGKLANGVVSVNAYGLLDTITFPLLFSGYKPQSRWHPSHQAGTGRGHHPGIPAPGISLLIGTG